MQKFLLRVFAFFGLVLGGVLAIPAAAEAATLYWVGADGANTSVATNWKTTDPASCGGGDSLAAPGATDAVIFDADCDNGATVNANLSVNDITFQSGYGGTVTQSAGVTIGAGLGAWDHLGGIFTGGDSSISLLSLHISGGTFTSTTGTLSLQGDLSRTAGSFTANGGTVSFAGSGIQTLTGETFYNLTIANIAASPGDGTDVDPSAAVTVTNTLSVSDGQFQPHTGSDFATVTIGPNGILKPDASATVTVSGDWTKSGTFTANTGTVTFDGTSQAVAGSGTTFYNFSKTEGEDNSTDETLTFTSGVTQTITNTLTLDGRDTNDRINLVSSSSPTKFTLDVTGGAASVDFLDVTDSQASTNNITCTNCVNGGGNDDGEAEPHWIFVSGIDLSGTVYSNEGSTALGSMTVRLAINGTDNTTAESNASTGAYSFTSISASAGDVLTFYLEDETQDAVTVTVSDGANLTGIDLYQDRLITRHDNASSLTNSNLSTAAVSSEDDISNIYSVSAGALTVADEKELLVWTGDTFAPGGSVTADDIDINGTFSAGANTVTVSGDWDITGGSFSSSGAVVFDGVSQALTGSTTFYDFSKTEGADDGTDEVLTIAAGTTQTITNALTLDGRDANDRINLVSSSSGTKFTLDVTGGAASVDFLDVADSQASTNSVTCTDCVNGTGNDDGEAAPHWIFTSSNTAPTAASIRSIAQATDGSGEVTFKVDIRDTDGDITQAKIEYSLDQDTWRDPRLGSATASEGEVEVQNSADYQIRSIDTDTGADHTVTLTIVWNSQEEIEAVENIVFLRVIPYDGTVEGSAVVSESFEVDNQAPQISDLVKLAATTTSLTWGWNVSGSENNFSAYELCYSTTASEVAGCTGSAKRWTTSQDTALARHSTDETTVTGLTAATTYAVKLTGVDTLGNAVNLTLTGSQTEAEPVLESDCGPGFIKVGGVCLAQGGGAGGGAAFSPSPANEIGSDEGDSEPEQGEESTIAQDDFLPILSSSPGPPPSLGERLNSLLDLLPAANQTATNILTVATTAAVTASLGVVSTLPTLLSNFLYWLERLGTGLIGLVGSRRRRPWGRVIDQATGKPLPQTIVRILDRQTQQVRDTSVTDAKGEFASLLPPGQYRLRVAKPGWEMEPAAPSMIGRLANEQLYDGNVVEIKHEQLVSVVVAMRPITAIAPTRLVLYSWLQRLEMWLAALSWPLLGVGSVLSAVAVLKEANTINIIIVAMYAALVTAKFAFARRLTQTLGRVTNTVTGEPLPAAFVQLFDAGTGRQVATKVTSPTGQFVFLPPPGVYTVLVSHPGYQPYRESHVVVRPEQTQALTLSVALMPEVPKTMAVAGLTGSPGV